jgi:hypothetical protein
MATKDWRKVREYEWFNKKKNQTLMIYWYAAHLDIVVQLFDRNKPMNKGGFKYLGKSYKTKSKALAYAKSYMRKH